jgi:cytochrome c biogenesis protein CcdA
MMVRVLLTGWLALSGIFQDTAKVEVVFFHDTGCPHCARVEAFFQKRLIPRYPFRLTRLEIHQNGNAGKMLRLARALEAKDVLRKGTPAVFIGDRGYQGDHRSTLGKIEAALRRAIQERAPSPLTFLPPETTADKLGRRLTLPAVVGAAAVDSVNPCAFAILVLLLGTILISSSGNRRKVLGAGLAFSAACFIAYLLMGVGLFTAIRVTGLQRSIYLGVAFLAIGLGLWNLKDLIWYGKGPVYVVPRAWQVRMRRLTAGIRTVPGAFFTGLVISLFLLPCTSGPYVVIIGMLSQAATRWKAVSYLLLYNVVFILPFLIITLLIGLGAVSADRFDRWRQVHMPLFNGITGGVLILIGAVMLILVHYGAV